MLNMNKEKEKRDKTKMAIYNPPQATLYKKIKNFFSKGFLLIFSVFVV